MRLLTPLAFADKYFGDESRPSELTLARWLRSEKLPGRKIGGKWYVDEHAWLAGDDDLVRRVLDEAG